MRPLFDIVPLILAGLIAAAIEAIRRRGRHAAYAGMWSAAFGLLAIGWLADVLIALAVSRSAPIGAAASLCWLGAALMLVQGLRGRRHRPDRRLVLAGVWVAIALGGSFALDLFPDRAVPIWPMVPLLSAIGLLVAAALSVGTRRAGMLEWVAMGALAFAAFANIVIVSASLTGVISGETFLLVLPQGAALAYAALGLALIVLLNADLAVRLERVARTDPLTGIWNRRGFDEAAPILIGRLRSRPGPHAAVAIADLDAFKEINDRHGHTVGDAVLINFARTLSTALEPGDFLARLGGEEFALLAVGCDGQALFNRVERVRASMNLPNAQRTTMPAVTVSFGVADFCDQTWSVRDALERADHALYRAKREGRNRVVMGDPPRITH